MRGIIRAELLRLGKRGPLLATLVAVPLLATILFGLGYASVFDAQPFDPVQLRQDVASWGELDGMTPEEAERYVDERVAQAESNHAMEVEAAKQGRAMFAFPQSLITILGSSMLLLLAMALVAATTLGDEFGWGTVRTTLLGSSQRSRVLLVRMAAMSVAAGLVIALLLLAASIAPLFLGVANRPLPNPLPGIDWAALGVFVLGLWLASLALIAFATLATVIVRNGLLALVSILVYAVVEAAFLTLLTRFKPFGFDVNGNPGDLAWTLDAFPAHGFTTMLDLGARATRAFAAYPGEVIPSIAGIALPVASFLAWGAAFALLALWRFRRMDIVE